MLEEYAELKVKLYKDSINPELIKEKSHILDPSMFSEWLDDLLNQKAEEIIDRKVINYVLKVSRGTKGKKEEE
jgi:hypothetical protein